MKRLKNILKHDIVYTTSMVVESRALSSNLFLIKMNIFRELKRPLPPQFVMVWVPGYEAIPMSIAHFDNNELWIIVKPVGPTTRALSRVKKGDLLGLYGPLGKPLVPEGDKYLLLAGGSGIATILHYLQVLSRHGKRCRVVFGCWRSDEVGAIPDLIKELGGEPVITCFDKECDFYGTVGDYVSQVNIEQYDAIIACGPLLMLKDVTERVGCRDNFIVILDSLVKCGIGLCGSCKIGGEKDLFLCIDGPGFYLYQVRDLFGC